MALSPATSNGPLGLTLKAWAKFSSNGVNGLQTLLASYNVTSITRGAAPSFDFVFTNAMSGTNYMVIQRYPCDDNAGKALQVGVDGATAVTTTTMKVCFTNSSGAKSDAYRCLVEFWE